MKDAASIAHEDLRQLSVARNVTVGGLVAALVVMHFFLGWPRSLPTLVAVTVLLLVFNAAVLVRLRAAIPVGRREVLGHLTLDIAALGVFFYSCGGATNPFVDLFLVPLAVAAARLPVREIAYVGGLTLAAYLFMVARHVPLPPPIEGLRGFECVGMWVKYALCGGFIAWLMSSVAARGREKERALGVARAKIASDDYLARAGSLAMGAAHEIRSPLCTIDVLVNEMLQRRDPGTTPRNLRLVLRQVETCRKVLTQLVGYGREALEEDPRLQPADRYLHDVVENWRQLRPNATLAFRRSGAGPAPSIPVGAGLGHAIINLLNNAADVSPEAVEMAASWSAYELSIQVLDRGPGLAPGQLEVLGHRLVTTKAQNGTGIGVLLARTIAERAGGGLQFSGRSGGGTCAELRVPLGGNASPARAGAESPATAAPIPPCEIRYYQASAAGRS